METLSLAAPQTLSGVNAEAQTIVHRIYQHILAQPVGQDFSLLGGEMGFALFERYYQNHFGLPEESRTWQRIEAGLEAIGEGEQIHTFARGVAGMAWSFLHLANTGLLSSLETDAQSIVEDLDEPLFVASMKCLQEGEFDYLHGGLSTMLYFLERTPSPRIHQYIKALVLELEKLSIISPKGGITWLFMKHGHHKPGDTPEYNLSLSHGVASIVAVLALAYEKGYERERCHKLIHLALRWMWNVRNKQDTSMFPYIVTDVLQDQHSRLAWCYGDLGIASAFYLAGEKLGYKPWKDTALHTIYKSTLRREFADTHVRDAGICHGSAGIAYIYHKFSKVSTNPIISSAARFWLTDTLQRSLPETEEAVYVQLTPTKEGFVPYKSMGLLEGEASIGMVLLSMLGAPTGWDRFLLLC
jgi:lantibiotic modifying enzyme